MRVIGLTGKTGAGKSTVAAFLKEKGCFIIDGDKIARDILLPGEPAVKELSDAFGEDIILPDGNIDRKKLASRAFASAEGTDMLNRITHPRITERFITERDKAEGIRYRTLIPNPAEGYPVMSDGCGIHSSEITANLVRRCLTPGKLLRRAMGEACFEKKAEIAALALAVAEPDTVSAVRINQPLMWGRKEDGFYLATSAFALENEAIDWINPVPAASLMTMGRDKIEFEPYDAYIPYFSGCSPLTAIYKTLDEMFDTGKDFCVNDFCVEAAKCWPEDELAVANMTVYEYLREKVHSKVIEGFTVDSPGSGAGLIAPQTRFRKICK